MKLISKSSAGTQRETELPSTEIKIGDGLSINIGAGTLMTGPVVSPTVADGDWTCFVVRHESNIEEPVGYSQVFQIKDISKVVFRGSKGQWVTNTFS